MPVVVIFNVIFGLLLAGIIFMLILLMRSIHKSLYLYRNVAYIGGILFAALLLLSLYSYLISCLLETKSLTLQVLFREFVDFPARFALFAFPVFSVICLLLIISNLSLIRHEGLRLKNILGVILGVMILGGTGAEYALAHFVENNLLLNQPESIILRTVYTFGNLFLLLLICYFECFFVGTVIMGYMAAKQVPKYDKDFIIILGCSIDKKGGLRPLLKGRANRAIRYAWEQEIATGRPVKYVPSGGQGADEIMSEGSAMELYLLVHGAEPDEIFPEKESKNTYENFLYSGRIIKEINPDAKVCFATTNYHMFRSGMLARKAGLDAEGISSKTKWYFWPNGFVREFFGIVNMKRREHLMVAGILFAGCALVGTISAIIGFLP